MYEKTWSGDWHARILERVQRLGFGTVTEYALDRAGVSLVDLAKELGSDDVAAVQVMYVLIAEATRTNTIHRLLRDLLVRELREHLPYGWNYPLTDESRFEAVGALVDWEVELRQTEIRDYLDEEATFAAGQALLNSELPGGWIPDGPDDPIIVAFVDRCLGRAPS